MRRVWEALARFWTLDHGLSIFLALLVIATFVWPLLAPVGPAGGLLSHTFFSLLLAAGVSGVARRRWAQVVMSGAALAALLVRWAHALSSSPALAVWREWALLVILVLLAVVVLAHTLRRGSVSYQRIVGAIAGYVLLGLAWASAYELVALGDPGAFSGATVSQGGMRSLVYYSFVTLTTMGYGDIAPIHPIARSLAVAEALTGQLYIAIVLARLVTLEFGRRRET